MKILVIDDSPLNQASARMTLSGHDLTIAESHDEALHLLGMNNGEHLSRQRTTEYEVVLSDLMLPASRKMLSPEAIRQFAGSEQPLGWALALLAARSGAKYVAVVSATNHHKHPAAFALECLGGMWYSNEAPKPQFIINGAKAGFFAHAPHCEIPCECSGSNNACSLCGGNGNLRGKDWGQVLNNLIQN